jgi:carbon-monoxide dehydrogenase medium subunit
VRPGSLHEAIAELERLGENGAPLAGCTWIMRNGLRREPFKRAYVALRDVEELRALELGDPAMLGALLTHADLGDLDDGAGPLGALAEAARRSAIPTVRSVATLGGNVCARGFAEAELTTALLALDAEVELVSSAVTARLPIEEFVASRDERAAGELLARVFVPAPAERRSWFERLTVLGANEYPVVAVAVALGHGGARVAVCNVEAVPRRSRAAEALLDADPSAGEEAGHAAAEELEARDDGHAPAWYRRAVLPPLVRKAVERCGTS